MPIPSARSNSFDHYQIFWPWSKLFGKVQNLDFKKICICKIFWLLSKLFDSGKKKLESGQTFLNRQMEQALATFQKKSLKSHNSQHPVGNPAPNKNWKLYDMIKFIHGYVVSVILTKFRINVMAKFLHFEFWFWHSFWFFCNI